MTHLGLVLLPWIVVAINGLFAKFQMLMGANGDDWLPGSAQLITLSQHMYAYRADLLMGFVLVPAGMIVMTIFVPRRGALMFSGCTALLVQVALSVEMSAYAVSGSFASMKMIALAIWWSLRGGTATFAALSLSDALYCVGWVMLVALVSIRVNTAKAEKATRLGHAGLGICALGIGACLVLFSTKAPAMTESVPLLKEAAESLMVEASGQELMSRELMLRSVPDLHRALVEETHNPAADQDGNAKYAGKAKGYNVLIFILESMPAEVFDPARDLLNDMPNVRRLRENSLVLKQHYTTYPLTNRALFSMATSMYIRTPAGKAVGERGIKLPGLVSSLKSAGYKTGFYGYVWRAPTERDDFMLKSLGFDNLREIEFGEAGDDGGAKTFSGPVMEVAHRDHMVLEKLKCDIRDWTSRNQPFAAMYFPEIGHDPWRDVTGMDRATVMQKGHALAAFHDGWLGEIVNELRTNGALDKTIIVVTADHGLRMVVDPGTRSPHLSSRKLDDIIMRVPMMIYVPRVVKKTVTANGPTSHLDLMPTLLELLGVREGRSLEEGLPVWHTKIASRRLFLPMTVFGSDGYFEGGSYYMQSQQKAIYKNSELHFTEQNRLSVASAEAEQARHAIESERVVEKALLYRVLNDLQ